MARSRKKDEPAEKQLADAILEAGSTLGLNTVFTTFLEIFATSIGAQMDPVYAKERDSRYKEIVSEMSPKTVAMYARLCALTFMAVRENKDDPRDILGAIYHKLKLNSEWNGQFFSPDDICQMMAQVIGVGQVPEEDEEDIITINEPTCGSGAMVIGAIWAMKQKRLDYQRRTLFFAEDIDIRCVWMAYIQFCLYRIPAVVIHGNTITQDEWSKWVTPYAAVPLIKLQQKDKQAEAGASA